MFTNKHLIESTLSKISLENKLSKNITLIKKVNDLLFKEINKLGIDIEMTKYSSYIDYLLEAKPNEIENFPTLIDLQSSLFKKIKELNKGLAIGVSDVSSYLNNIKQVAVKKNRAIFDREIFSDVYIDDEISEEAANNLIDYFNIAISMIDPSLLNKISNVTLLVKSGQEDDFFSSLDNNVISLTINENTNMLLLVAVLVHEVIHFIEHHNKNVNDLALEFIKKRAVNVQKAENRRGRPSANWKDAVAYDLKMDDPHAGLVYANKMTEVLTTGVQNLILAPVLHLFKDPELMSVLDSFFLMKEETSVKSIE